MKKINIFILNLICTMLLLIPYSKVHAQTLPVTFPASITTIFPDPNLAILVSELLGLTVNDVVTASQLKNDFRLSVINLSNRNVSNLEGLQYTNASQITANGNQITDLSPLTNMVNLRGLWLEDNPLMDTSTLGYLPNLRQLSLKKTPLTTVAFTNTYPLLSYIDLSSTQISTFPDFSSFTPILKDIYLNDTPFSNLSDLLPYKGSLVLLDVSRTRVHDFSAIADLGKLSSFNCLGNPDADFDSFPSVLSLGVLNLSDNRLTSVHFLSQYTRIASLYLNNNEIRNASVLKNVEIGDLHLAENKIKDASWILELNKILDIDLNNNLISDIRFLDGVTKFRSILIRNQTIILPSTTLGSRTFKTTPIVKFFPGVLSRLVDSDDQIILYLTDGNYQAQNNEIAWQSVNENSNLTYAWDMGYANYITNKYLYFSGYISQPITSIGYTINYYYNALLHHQSLNVATGTSLIAPVPPTKSGHVFDGWYRDVAMTNRWDFTIDKVTGNHSLYAKFIPIKNPVMYHTVRFDRMDGTATITLQVEHKSLLNSIISPTRPGYYFKGWYLDKNFQISWDNTQVIESSFVAYAKWQSVTNPNVDGSLPPTGLDKNLCLIAFLLISIGSVILTYSQKKK